MKNPERRSFLTKIWIGLGLVALVEFISGGVTFFISGRQGTGQDSKSHLIEAGDLADFPSGSMTFIHTGNCYLSRLDDGGMLAISRKCTHLGCVVPWVEERNQFECPCHSSVFDNHGNVLKSPAPRALDIYSISIEQNNILIDIGSPIRRTSFAADQLVYPQELS